MQSRRKIYAHVSCFLCSDVLSKTEQLAVECCLREGGASIVTCEKEATTHIICHPDAYERFIHLRKQRFIAIVRPEWVFKTFLLQQIIPEDRFSANPMMIFSSLVIAAGPIEKDPRKVIDGLISHFGGQIVDKVEQYSSATHILSPDEAVDVAEVDHHRALRLSYTDGDVSQSLEAWMQWQTAQPASRDFALPSCVVAYLAEFSRLSTQYYVTYSWIEECVRRKARVPEGPFICKGSSILTGKKAAWKTQPEIRLEDLQLDKCAQVYQVGKAESGMEMSLLRKSSRERLASLQTRLSGAIVLLSQHIHPQLKEKISEVLKAAKAKVANVPLGSSYEEIVRKVVANASFVICRYQAGFEYEEAKRQNKQVVSIFWVLSGHSVSEDKCSTLQDIIQRPLCSFGGIPGMQGFVITLSGYSSRTSPTREEIQIAIHATGACMLPVLSRTHSTHLLCYEAQGEKYKKAQSWGFTNILSHEWLLACLKTWDYVAEDAFLWNSSKSGITTMDTASTVKTPAKKDLANQAPSSEKENTTPIDKNQSMSNQDEKLDEKAEKPNAIVCAEEEEKVSEKESKRNAKGRFDVDEMLTELDGSTPVGKAKQVDEQDNIGAPATKDIACKLFDTPTLASKQLLGSKEASVCHEDIPDEMEFQFGKNHIGEPDVEREAEESNPLPTKDLVTVVKEDQKESPIMWSADSTSEDLKLAVETPSAVNQSAPPEMKSSTARAKKASSAGAKRKAASLTKEESAQDGKNDASSGAAPKKKRITKESSSGDKPASTPTPKFVFLLTGSREELARNESIVSALGGRTSRSGRKYDSSCTHIICSELKRTEKFVAGCAAGKWILKPSFLEASSAAGHFVNEVDHEWGCNASDSKLMDPRIWPKAPSFWRKKRAAGKPGAFTKWRFLVHAKSVPPPDMCDRIIRASGGTVIPWTKTIDLATLSTEASTEAPVLALVPPDLSSRDTWMNKVKAQKIDCINASFLIDYLTKEQKNKPTIDAYRV